MNDATTTRSFSIADRLREMILRGDFAPEARLQEIQLANLMDVSRTPIREALRMLAKEGLLNYEPNKGYQVRKFSLDDILAAFRVRAVLEGLGCRLIAEKGMSEHLNTQLKQALVLGDTLLQPATISEAFFNDWRAMNRDFHVAILLETQNDLLIRFARDARTIPIVFNGSFQWYTLEDFRRSNDHHHVIYDAMKQGQGERADMFMREHIYHASEIIRKNFKR